MKQTGYQASQRVPFSLSLIAIRPDSAERSALFQPRSPEEVPERGRGDGGVVRRVPSRKAGDVVVVGRLEAGSSRAGTRSPRGR